ncbi:MAG: pyruvate dehydrogenase [Anaerolineales bacterium]|nr:pyruvate dehydrogenase [Chloroflexota bacterium]MBL6982243.1 pyruvate dehydrogenase [Anaerolineales bacterium]
MDVKSAFYLFSPVAGQFKYNSPAMTQSLEIYRQLYRIRRFEETVLDNFPKGLFYGTTHTYLGQEANAVGVLTHLQEDDIVFSNHRCHGHFLAYGGEMRVLFAELMGKSTGVCGGRGGSQHLQWRNFYSNGVQGGILPVATGMALAEKRKESAAITIAFLGDGTLGEGVLYESLNLASLWDAPILFVVENNLIAQTTPIELSLAGSITARFSAFDIPVTELDTSDVQEISEQAKLLLDETRFQGGPRALVLHTLRFGPHSKGDDTRDPELVAAFKRERDPVAIHAPRLDPESRAAIEAEVDLEVEFAFEKAMSDPYPEISGQWAVVSGQPSADVDLQSPTSNIQSTVLKSINNALHQTLSHDDRVLVIGEDILDPYGGAFKVTQGLSDAFPEQVLTTPISEAGIVGVAAGMALRGLRPVVEIMFGDFVTLIADQVINHVAKFRWMYNDQVRVPLVIRTPMGGRRGYGPTHSQTLEKLFLGVPGLRVLAPTALGNPGELLAQAIADDDPMFFVENKLLYLQKLQDEKSLTDFELQELSSAETYAPTYSLSIRRAPAPELTILAYGYMAELAREAVRQLAYAFEIFAELVVPTQLSPFDNEDVVASARRTHKVLVVEEGTLTLGWGAEILARLFESMGSELMQARRVAAREFPVPASGPLEETVLPGIDDIILSAREMMEN